MQSDPKSDSDSKSDVDSTNLTTLTRINYDDLVLGKEYMIKKNDIIYKGTYYMHYRKCHDTTEPLTFMNVTPNPENKKRVEFEQTDEYYM